MKKGTIYGVSVGPGNPLLLTQLAINTILSADIIFLPTAPKENCRAYKIIKAAIPEIDEEKILCVETADMANPELQGKRYDTLADEIKKLSDKGKSVAFLALGEVSLYSTFIYVQDRLLLAGYKVELVSGISSIQEAVNTLCTYIAKGDEEVHIFPNCNNMQEKLSYSGTKVFMKPKGELDNIIKEIELYANNRPDVKAFGVSQIGTENEIIADSVAELKKLKGYMTLFVVRG